MSLFNRYRGRFAPSPTGPLHFGSLVTALGSYLHAKHHHGSWLVRMEDLDTPRCVPAAANEIESTLKIFGLHSDEPIVYQSQRTEIYQDALRQLDKLGAVYPCSCTRKEIADSASLGTEGHVYPGTCRIGLFTDRQALAWRVRTTCSANTENSAIEFDDELQGHRTQDLAKEIGDFVVKRADGLFAYQLAVVVDDALQGITHVVRGADLLTSTPRQIHLQRILKLPTPSYTHLPIIVNELGEKLSKQTLAAPVTITHPEITLINALHYLHQRPPEYLRDCDIQTILKWSIQNWRIENLQGITQVKLS